jgi:CheY-like chemotaxis protein
MQLRKFGFKVLTCNNGQQAIDRLMEEPVKEEAKRECILVLMDCNMPMKNGYEATKTLRELMANRKLYEIPIIAWTAYTSEEDKQKCLDSGMNDVLTKPVKLDQLKQMLEKYTSYSPDTLSRQRSHFFQSLQAVPPPRAHQT